jgi:hypothetical protein
MSYPPVGVPTHVLPARPAGVSRLWRHGVAGLLLGALALVQMPALAQLPADSTTTRVSVAADGSQANHTSQGFEVTPGGRYIVFRSKATNLVGVDTASYFNIYVRDREAGTTVLISRPEAGGVANGSSYACAISANGRWVVYASDATNLVTGDPSAVTDLFVHDRDADADGMFDEPGQTATVRLTASHDGSLVEWGSSWPDITDDGRFVGFDSYAPNLVPGDTNNVFDTFVIDRDTDEDGVFDEAGATATVRVSVAGDGTEANDGSFYARMNADGRFVVFYSTASNLVPGDTNGWSDIFVRDRDTDADGVFDEPGFVATRRLSAAPDGSPANERSQVAVIDSVGRVVAFRSLATNIVAGDSNDVFDVFVVDRDTDGNGVFDEAGGTSTTRVSAVDGGGEANGASDNPALSPNGRFVGYHSYATDLVAGDTNDRVDAFVYDRLAGSTVRVSVATDGTQANGDTLTGPLSFTLGHLVMFNSYATNLVADDTNGMLDVFLAGPLIDPLLTLTVAKAGSGSGTVTSAPEGIDCGATCGADFVNGTEVTLTAQAAASDAEAPGDSVFTGWSGDADCADGVVTLYADVSCTATFELVRTLTVTKAGNGAGTVTSAPAGIACGATCAAQFADGTTVILTPAAAPGSAFAGWSGAADCADGSVTLTGDLGCTATFVRGKLLTVQLTGTGAGTVTTTPAGVACPGDCTEYYVPRQAVTLTPAAGAASVFMGFTGALDCRDSQLTMGAARRCVARFELLRTLQVTTVLENGAEGQVTSVPPGIACGADCTEDFAHGTMVTLKAVRAAGTIFAGWAGACTHKRLNCRVPMTGNQTATATFRK